ncbi:hypothetical protein JKF63_01238 [Porcisia hertigi]|uniref:Uncharacterized protein n=1 Tax=Porcisia hertigi TaxID=2761500 RepID=A0A836HHA5_9TRYP|nr:hypothetical protein JKF63_01238 [Porcisia hertigi]
MQNFPTAAARHAATAQVNTTGSAAPFPLGGASPASEFEACCRALSHKANQAVVEQLPVLQSGAIVDLSRNYVGSAGLQAIAVILPQNPNLTEIRAPRNGLSNDAVVHFCRAMRRHPKLSVLDFSDNRDVSLAAGLSLLNLAQLTPSLRVVKLEGTHVPAAVESKLARALEYNAKHHSTFSPPTAAAPLTASAVAPPSASPSRAAVPVTNEVQTLQKLRAQVTAALENGYRLPPASPKTGWRVLDVAILAPPLLFETEVRILCNEIFPRINKEFASHRIALCPVVVSDSAEVRKGCGTVGERLAGSHSHRTAGSYSRALHFRSARDVLSIAERGRFMAIELVGDHPGDYAQLPASEMLQLGRVPHTASERAQIDDDKRPQEAAVPLQPVLYEAHEAALRATRWLFVATRRETRALEVPAALAPLLTADPSIAHPDRHGSVTRAIVVGDGSSLHSVLGANKVRESSGKGSLMSPIAIPTSVEWDYGIEEYQWKRHLSWREHVVATAPVAELVVSKYTATFDCIDPHGCVRLKHLGGFQIAMYDRLRTVVEACIDAETRNPEATDVAELSGTGLDSLDGLLRRIGTQRVWDRAYFQALAAAGSGAAKKNLMNRMILYAANPPSRNILLLHGTDSTSLANLIARSVTRLQSLQHTYTLAAYTTRSVLLQEEPTDLRGAMTHIVSQLTTDAAVLRYVNAEVDLERLSAFFRQLLSGSVAVKKIGGAVQANATMTAAAAAMRAAGLPDYIAQYTLGSNEATDDGQTASTHAYVVLLDGLEGFATPVQPCGALVHPPGGAGHTATDSGGVEPSSWSAEMITNSALVSAAPPLTGVPIPDTRRKPQSVPMNVLLPSSLARNVRLIASCATDSATFQAFHHRGRDSVEKLSFGAVSANEVEQYLSPVSLARIGLVFSDDDFNCARCKRDAPIAEYMNYLLDAARSVHEAPGFLTQSQAIQTFPETLEDAAQGVYDRLVEAFGLPVTRHALGLLMTSRWGLFLPELRDLLPSLSTCRLQELLRLLRPALEQEVPPAAAEMMSLRSGNVVLGPIRLTAPSFLEVVRLESLKMVADELQVEDDQRVWHAQLAQYYISIVYRWLQPSRTTEMPIKVSRVNQAPAPESYAHPETHALERQAMKEVIYHIAQSGNCWSRIDVTILSLPFMERVYELGLGYAYLRDLTAAFNERYQRHLLGEDIVEPSWQQHQIAIEYDSAKAALREGGDADSGLGASSPLSSRFALPAVLSRMRDYICFAHEHGLLLSLHPNLVAQVALQIPATLLNSVQRDAVTYLYNQLEKKGVYEAKHAPPSRVFFKSLISVAATGQGKQPTHLGPITCCAFLPNRRFIVTASSDRSLAWVNPENGTVAWYARQLTAAVESLTVCRTSGYVAALSGDRSVWIYDGLQGTLVSQYRGSKWFDAPIVSLTFSARGRYLWVLTTGARVYGFVCESGALRCSMGLAELLQSGNASFLNKETAESMLTGPTAAEEMRLNAAEWRHRRTHVHILVDSEDDEVCTTVTATEVRQWRLHPWDESLSSRGDDIGPAPKSTALVAAELTMSCSLGTSPVHAPARPSGYKIMELWQPSSLQLPHKCVLVAPHSDLEVQLLMLRHGDETARVVVRFPLVATPTSTPAEVETLHEVSLMRTSPDGRWLSVGLTSGAINLFCVRAAYRVWQQQQQQGQEASSTAVVCRPTRIYTSLITRPGLKPTPPRSLVFHRTGQFLFALSNRLVSWHLPDADSVRLPTDAAEAICSVTDGEYVQSNTPTCLTVLPPPTLCSNDSELPANIADIAIGDDSGRVSLLKLWRQVI